MPTSDELEKRLQQELKNKLFFVEKSPGRPTEAMIQEKIEKHGDQCYEAPTILEAAKREYVNNITAQEEYLKERGGALHYYVQLKLLVSEHQYVKFNMEKNLHIFEMAHEWYEILVAADETSELDRLAFLNELNSKIFKEPSKPGDEKYPEMIEYCRDYSRSSVREMTKKHIRLMDFLISEEWKAKEEAKRHCAQMQQQEEEELRKIHDSIRDLSDNTHRRFNELERRINKRDDIERLRNEMREEFLQTRRRTNIHEILDGVHADIQKRTNELKKHLDDVESTLETVAVELHDTQEAWEKQIADRKKELDQMHEKHQHEIAKINETINEKHNELTRTVQSLNINKRSRSTHRAETTMKRRAPDHPSDEEEEEIRRTLQQLEEELEEVDRYLATHITRERQFGSRKLKDNEQNLQCVYCKQTGDHYSDSCPTVRTVRERRARLLEEGRCTQCLLIHGETACPKPGRCFYCHFNDYERGRGASDHHASLCRRPEEWQNAVQRRQYLNDDIQRGRQLLEEVRRRPTTRN